MITAQRVVICVTGGGNNKKISSMATNPNRNGRLLVNRRDFNSLSWRCQMELEKIIEGHGKKLEQHDKEISRINDNLLEMQKGMNEGLARVDESNKFLREQNMRQSEQNVDILNAVLNRNEKSEERNYALKMLDKTNMWKMILGIGASAGAVFAFVLELIKFFGGK